MRSNKKSVCITITTKIGQNDNTVTFPAKKIRKNWNLDISLVNFSPNLPYG